MKDLKNFLIVLIVTFAPFVLLSAAQDTKGDGFEPKPELTEVQKLKFEIQTLQENQLGLQLQLTQCSGQLTQTQAQAVAASLTAKRKQLLDDAIKTLGGDPAKDRLTDKLTLEPIPGPHGSTPE